MRILITGAHGQLGSELQKVLAGETLILADRPDFELTIRHSLARLSTSGRRPSSILRRTPMWMDVRSIQTPPVRQC